MYVYCLYTFGFLLSSAIPYYNLKILPPLKHGCHDITEILLKVALNTKNQINHII